MLSFGDINSGQMNESAVCGIDVAFAKNKPLPVCVRRGAALEPLPLRVRRFPVPPRGAGNRGALDDAREEASHCHSRVPWNRLPDDLEFDAHRERRVPPASGTRSVSRAGL